MKLTRRGMTVTFAAVGLAGVLAGGAGIAVAATGTPSTGTAGGTAAPPAADWDGGFGMPGMAFGQSPMMTSAANYLGLSPSDLVTQMHEGKSLADIARAQGKTVSGLEGAMTASMRDYLDSNTTLTADQKTAILARLTSHLDAMVNATHPAGVGFGMMGRGMMGAWR